ncbi:MAG: hypothetical protein Q9215_008268, partial [Flavoplaca cf. flavocitrina]
RRSRARRKEYILELEAKVRAYEQEGVSASAEIQAAARKVVVENEVLREEVIRLRAENEMLRRGVGLEERISEGRDDQRSSQAVGRTREGGEIMPTSSAGKRKRANDYDNDGKGKLYNQSPAQSSELNHNMYTTAQIPSTSIRITHLLIPNLHFPLHPSHSDRNSISLSTHLLPMQIFPWALPASTTPSTSSVILLSLCLRKPSSIFSPPLTSSARTPKDN